MHDEIIHLQGLDCEQIIVKFTKPFYVSQLRYEIVLETSNIWYDYYDRFQLSAMCPPGSIGDVNVTYGLEQDEKSMNIYQLPNMILKKYYYEMKYAPVICLL